jgi:ferredoxin
LKSIVIYYSQTGNTKKIAQAIQQGVAQQAGQCDIARLREIKPEDWVNYDLIGIGSPVWSSCPTTNVVYHIKSLPPTVKGKHAFFYCTHGALPGRCIIRGVKPLQEQGLTVVGWKDWYGGASFPRHAKPWFTDGHPDAIDLAEAESFGAAMADHSRKIFQGLTDIIPTLPSPEASDQIYGIGHPFLYSNTPPNVKSEEQSSRTASTTPSLVSNTKTEGLPIGPAVPMSMDYVMKLEGIPGGAPGSMSTKGELRINTDKCTGCGLCAKACFCNNIDASVFPPVFLSQPCEADFYCEGICPTGAIEYDFPPPDPNAGKTRGAMHKMLDLAEAAGRFRRLVREEDIGWQTPWQVITTHPRHKMQ